MRETTELIHIDKYHIMVTRLTDPLIKGLTDRN